MKNKLEIAFSYTHTHTRYFSSFFSPNIVGKSVALFWSDGSWRRGSEWALHAEMFYDFLHLIFREGGGGEMRRIFLKFILSKIKWDELLHLHTIIAFEYTQTRVEWEWERERVPTTIAFYYNEKQQLELFPIIVKLRAMQILKREFMNKIIFNDFLSLISVKIFIFHSLFLFIILLVVWGSFRGYEFINGNNVRIYNLLCLSLAFACCLIFLSSLFAIFPSSRLH